MQAVTAAGDLTRSLATALQHMRQLSESSTSLRRNEHTHNREGWAGQQASVRSTRTRQRRTRTLFPNTALDLQVLVFGSCNIVAPNVPFCAQVRVIDTRGPAHACKHCRCPARAHGSHIERSLHVRQSGSRVLTHRGTGLAHRVLTRGIRFSLTTGSGHDSEHSTLQAMSR